MTRAQRYAALGSLGAAALILVAGFVLARVVAAPVPPRQFHGSVQGLLPRPEEVPQWRLSFQPIADTPEIQARVNEELNFDEGVYAVYQRGNMRLAVYIAYWQPGRMSHRLVAGHTPDVCWVTSGWRKRESLSGVALPDGRGGHLLPVEQRTMMLNGNTEHVVFWHLLDGVPMNYGTGAEPPWHAMFTDMFTKRLHQKPEQFFIRISSNEPVAAWLKTDVYVRLMEHLVILQSKT